MKYLSLFFLPIILVVFLGIFLGFINGEEHSRQGEELNGMQSPVSKVVVPDSVSTDHKSERVRILELLPPNLLVPLAIEPDIPDNFVAMSPKGKLDVFDWTYWGPKKVLEKYFKDENSLSQSIIRVKLGLASQEEVEHPDRQFLRKDYESNGLDFGDLQLKWGNYPIYALRGFGEDISFYQAFVGLNDPEGTTLKFELVYPSKRKKPSKKDIKLWEKFLINSKQLSEPLFFKAHGQDIQEGYTIVNTVGIKYKLIAEQRESDNKLQIVIIPIGGKFDYKLFKAETGLMGAKWHYGEPLVKVYGTLTMEDGNAVVIMDQCISVLMKKVKEFSHNRATAKLSNHQIIYED
jgi:hypothetical protein